MKSHFSQSGQVFPQFWVFEAIFEARGKNLSIQEVKLLWSNNRFPKTAALSAPPPGQIELSVYNNVSHINQ